ncbi:MAG: 30S ribosomal protein S5 [Planctomycetes bacterium]|nr:30S ribosomal protein S5 [Planctomycetota bacterium]
MNKITVDATELREETLLIKRCALVVKGGRRFSFSAYVVVGNENGILGLGHGKASDVAGAIAKASKEARRKLFSVEIAENTVPHRINGKFTSSNILIMPAKPGTGVIACTPVRAIMQMAGIHDVLTKSFGSNNTVNLAKATIDGLKKMRSRKTVEALRGVELA